MDEEAINMFKGAVNNLLTGDEYNNETATQFLNAVSSKTMHKIVVIRDDTGVNQVSAVNIFKAASGEGTDAIFYFNPTAIAQGIEFEGYSRSDPNRTIRDFVARPEEVIVHELQHALDYNRGIRPSENRAMEIERRINKDRYRTRH